MWYVTRPLILLVAISQAEANPLTDREIPAEAARLAQAAKQEPPFLALDTLLRTATLVKP